MYAGKTLFAQLMDFLPWTTFARIVEAPQPRRLALHFATDLLSDALRKNGALSGGYQRRIQTQRWRPMQPAESVRVLTGH
jgi:hypothetical protein